MKKLISELSEQEINYWVAKAESRNFEDDNSFTEWVENGCIIDGFYFDPCKNPAQAWPIIEREKIHIATSHNDDWWKSICPGKTGYKFGTTSLIAAMRCRIAMVYGDSVEVDDE